MRTIIISCLFIYASQMHGQFSPEKLAGISIGKVKKHTATDTIPIVTYLKSSTNKKPLFYLDEEIVDEQVLGVINPNNIKEITVQKDTVEINGQAYYGTVDVKTKEDYQPKLITLNALKSKYLNGQEDKATLFILNGKIINGDYDKLRIDEKYILKIEVQDLQNDKEHLDISVISLLTRNEENLKKANTIYLRGNKNSNVNKTSY